MRSVFDAIKSIVALAPLAASAAQNGTVIDTMGFNTLTFVVSNGAATGSPSSYTVDAKVQESAASDGSGMTDVTGATITQITADGATKVIRVEGLGTSRKRYLRIVVTPALSGGSTPKALIGAVANLGRAYSEPVANTN